MRSLMFAAFTFASVFTTKADAQKPTSDIINAFHAQFPLAGSVKWSNSARLYRAEFIQGSEKNYAYFDQSGELVVVGQYISYNLLPKRLQKDLARLYPGQDHFEIFEVIYDNNADYFASFTVNGRTVILKSTQLSLWKNYPGITHWEAL